MNNNGFSEEEIEDVTSRPPTEEELNLRQLFLDLNKGQIEFLDQAGKRIIELVTALLGVLLAVIAFGGSFPPSYLQGDTFLKALSVVTLLLYLLSLSAGVITLQPWVKREYYAYNLTQMRRVLAEITEHKSLWGRIATYLFLGGSIALGSLLVSIILAA
jgi:hypothetical protein